MAITNRATSSRGEKIAQARLLYDAGAPIPDILDLLGMSTSQFLAFRQANGWPLRASPIRRVGKGAPEKEAPGAGKPRAAPLPSGSLIARLEDAVEREFAHAEAALSKRTPKSVEVSARTLASLVRTLAELKRMSRDFGRPGGGAREDDGRDDSDDDLDPPPRELAELRAELARRLERLRGERETR